MNAVPCAFNRAILVITARADALTRAELNGFPAIVLYDYDITQNVARKVRLVSFYGHLGVGR